MKFHTKKTLIKVTCFAATSVLWLPWFFFSGSETFLDYWAIGVLLWVWCFILIVLRVPL